MTPLHTQVQVQDAIMLIMVAIAFLGALTVFPEK